MDNTPERWGFIFQEWRYVKIIEVSFWEFAGWKSVLNSITIEIELPVWQGIHPSCNFLDINKFFSMELVARLKQHIMRKGANSSSVPSDPLCDSNLCRTSATRAVDLGAIYKVLASSCSGYGFSRWPYSVQGDLWAPLAQRSVHEEDA